MPNKIEIFELDYCTALELSSRSVHFFFFFFAGRINIVFIILYLFFGGKRAGKMYYFFRFYQIIDKLKLSMGRFINGV